MWPRTENDKLRLLPVIMTARQTRSMTKQAAIQTSTCLCTSLREIKKKKFTQPQNKNRDRNIHKANVMTHQTVHQTKLFCHTLPVVLFFQPCVYKTQTQRRWGLQAPDNLWMAEDTLGLLIHQCLIGLYFVLPWLCNNKFGTHQQESPVFRAVAIHMFVSRYKRSHLKPPSPLWAVKLKHSHLLMQFPDLLLPSRSKQSIK